jgi:hypothetical protein
VTCIFVTQEQGRKIAEHPLADEWRKDNGEAYPFPFPDDVCARVIMEHYNPHLKNGKLHIIVTCLPNFTGTIQSSNDKQPRASWGSVGDGTGNINITLSDAFLKVYYENFGKPVDGILMDEPLNEVFNDYAGLAQNAIFVLRAIPALGLRMEQIRGRDLHVLDHKIKGIRKQNKGDRYYVLNLSSDTLGYLPKPEENCHGKSGIKQRWHMCRGHYRHLKSGKVVFVKGHYRGDKALGIVHKDYAFQSVDP